MTAIDLTVLDKLVLVVDGSHRWRCRSVT